MSRFHAGLGAHTVLPAVSLISGSPNPNKQKPPETAEFISPPHPTSRQSKK